MKKVIGFFSFVLCICISFSYVNELFRQKLSDITSRAFYENEDDLDVVCMGSSHMYYTVLPTELWNNFGITSMNFSSGRAGNKENYYRVKELLRTKPPKVIVIESLKLCKIQLEPVIFDLHIFFDQMPLSFNKLRATKALTYYRDDLTEDDRKAIQIPFLLYHSRWKELSKTDFVPDKKYSKGIFVDYNCQDFSVLEGQSFLSEAEKIYDQNFEILDPVELDYLYKIHNLCEQNGI